jgi:hypothetical protein
VSRGTSRFPSTGSRASETTDQAVALRNATVAIANTVTEMNKIRTLMANIADTPSGRRALDRA